MRAIVTGGPDVTPSSIRAELSLVKKVNKAKHLPLVNGRALILSGDEIVNLRQAGFVVEPDERVGIPPFPQVPMRPAGAGYPTEELDPEKPGPMRQMLDCEVTEIHDREIRGRRTHIGFVDTGIDTEHPGLFAALRGWCDFVDDSEDPFDPHGHGTACIGIAMGDGAKVEKFHGAAPSAECSMARVLDESGYGYTSWIIEGLGWLADQGVDIVSVSLGSDNPDYTILSRALDQLVERGIIVCCAAGNSGPGPIGQPANAYGAITVAACDWDGSHADFSSLGPATGLNGESIPKPDIMAWGRHVALLRAAGTTMGRPLNDFYTWANGTSFSAPFVAGLAALYLQAGSNTDLFKTALMSAAAANPLYTHEQEGAGLPRIRAAIDKDYEAIPPGPPTPSPRCRLRRSGFLHSVPIF